MEQYSKVKTASIKTASSYQNKADDSQDSGSENKSDKPNVNKEFKQGSISGYAHMLSGNKGKDK
jgi:hypothetical protein